MGVKCESCKVSFESVRIYEMHQEIVHKLQNSYDNPTESSKDEKQADSCEPKEKKTSKKNFSCDECGSNWPTSWRLREHLRTHSREKPFSCDICEKALSSKSSLRHHYRTHSDERPFSCDICAKQFISHVTFVIKVSNHLEIWDDMKRFTQALKKILFHVLFVAKASEIITNFSDIWLFTQMKNPIHVTFVINVSTTEAIWRGM